MTDSVQQKLNRHARDAALRSVSPATNLAAPVVTYQAQGPLLLIGPEHRIRLAAHHVAGRVDFCALVTERMPSAVDDQMEAASALSAELALQRLPLLNIQGYLGQFRVSVQVNEEPANLAQIFERGRNYFNTVVDLGDEPFNAATLKPAGYFVATATDAIKQVIDEAVALQGEFEKPRYFTINADLCAHSANEVIGCTRCLDVCPADAIRSHEWQIEIDAHLCHGAGGCATACPTSAIRYGYPQPQQTLDACRRLLNHYYQADGEAPCLLIYDAAFGREWYQGHLQSDQLDPRWVGLEIEELGASGMELWLSALAWGAAEVVMLEPPTLPPSIAEVLGREVAVAQQMLEGLSLGDRIRVSTPEFLSIRTETAAVQPSIELTAGHNKREQLSAAAAYLFNHSSLTSGPHTRVSLPKGAPFGQVALHDARCTLCMACVSACPASALGAGSDKPQLSFTEDACVQCGLCEQACPEDALQLVASYQLDPVPRQQARVMKEEEPFCCVRCGKPFATQGAIALMLEKLASHSMFAEGGLERIKMCGDCRVADLVISDPGADLFEYAKGRAPGKDEIRLAKVEDRNQ